MGDANHACRGFETPSLGSDLWPMGFDVDLALEAPGTRKDPGSSLVTAGLNPLHSACSTAGGGYNDIHHLTGLSSILQRSDDLHPGDICQMTDLTNSLPKGDSESAQSLLAKLACHDLGPDLTASVDANHKEIENALFDQNAAALSHGAGNGVSNVLSHKTLESADVYGRMTCYGGKLILQLRHFNLNTNYTLNVTECWLCGDKVSSGPQLCPHKHSLNGLFQVNEEYVQLEIEHYIIPEHALDAPDSQDMTDNMLQHSDASGLHHMTTPRDLDIPENISGNGDALGLDGGGGVGISASGATLHYTATADGSLMPPLSDAPNLMNHAMTSQNPCLNPSFEQLPLPSMTVTSTSDMNASIPDMEKNDSMSTATQALPSVNTPLIGCTSSTPVLGCSVNTPVMSLTPSENVPSTSMMATPLQRKLPMNNNQMSLVNNYAVDNVLTNFSVDPISSTPVPTQSVLRDITAGNKDTLQYHLPFSDSDYSCHTSGVTTVSNKQPNDPCLTSLDSVSLNLESQIPRNDITPKKQDVGSKKRKSKVQRKSGSFQDSSNRIDTLDTPSKNFTDDSLKRTSSDSIKKDCLGGSTAEYRQIARTDASFEDWIRQNLPEDDLIVNENHLKSSSEIESKLAATETNLESNQARKEIATAVPNLESNETRKELSTTATSLELNHKRKEIVEKLPRSREPDQTSRLAAHMLKKGIDLTCRVCQKDFGKDVKVYKIHMKEHGVKETELFACCFCTKSFDKSKHYIQHLKTHIKDRRFSCQLCTASYTREAKLRRHMLTHNKDGPKREFECTKCSKSFTTKYYLTSHLQSHSSKKFKCDICGVLFLNQYNLDTHKKRHTKDRPFKCELCDKTFLRRDFLDGHMENMHKNRKLKCEVCDKLFSRKDVLKRHLAVHNNETHECEICAKKFTRKDRLLTHSKTHKSSSMYKCSLCPASFIRKSVLDKHEKIHQTKEQCNICYTFLPSKQRLVNHMKIHAPENAKDEDNGMHKCEVCNKMLTSKEVLRKHLHRIHGKVPKAKKEVKPVEREKRFFCQWCSKGFTRSCNLNSHLLKAHSKDADDDEFEDDLSSVLKSKLESSSSAIKATLSSSSSATSSANTSLTTSSSSATTTTVNSTTNGPSSSSQNSSFPVVCPFPSSFPAASPSSTPPHPPPALPVPSHFPSSGPPDSPINLSTDAITAAAYLLAYLSYPGPY